MTPKEASEEARGEQEAQENLPPPPPPPLPPPQSISKAGSTPAGLLPPPLAAIPLPETPAQVPIMRSSHPFSPTPKSRPSLASPSPKTDRARTRAATSSFSAAPNVLGQETAFEVEQAEPNWLEDVVQGRWQEAEQQPATKRRLGFADPNVPSGGPAVVADEVAGSTVSKPATAEPAAAEEIPDERSKPSVTLAQHAAPADLAQGQQAWPVEAYTHYPPQAYAQHAPQAAWPADPFHYQYSYAHPGYYTQWPASYGIADASGWAYTQSAVAWDPYAYSQPAGAATTAGTEQYHRHPGAPLSAATSSTYQVPTPLPRSWGAIPPQDGYYAPAGQHASWAPATWPPGPPPQTTGRHLGKRSRNMCNGSGLSVAPVFIQINKRITGSRSVEGVMEVVRSSLVSFDAVCMATALHTMASLNTPNQYERLPDDPDFQRLMQMIGEKVETFTARNLANALWAMAKMGYHPGEELLEKMQGQVLQKLPEFNPQNLANTLWAFATLGHVPSKELLDGMATAAEARMAEFSSQNISNTVLAYAKMEYNPGELMDAAAKIALAKLDTFTPQALSNTVWAFSKLDAPNRPLLDAIARCALLKIHNFNAQNVANTVWAYANLAISPGEELLRRLAERAQSAICNFSAQNVSNTVWAYARLNYPHRGLLVAATAHTLRMLSQMQPQSVANILWSYATLHYMPQGDLLNIVAAHVLENLEQFSPQNLSNTVWALATLQSLHKDLMEAVASEVSKRLAGPKASEFSRQHLANTLWAYATLDVDAGKRFLGAASRAMALRAHECNPQEISNTVWACAKLKHYNKDLLDSMAKEAQLHIDKFSQQNLANLAWAYGKLSYYDSKLMDSVAYQSTARVKELSLQHVTNILWAYASFMHLQPSMMAAFVAEVRQRLAQEPFNAQQLSNLLWSLCISELCEQDVWDAVMTQFGRLDGAPETGDLPEEALAQIYQSYLLMQIDKPHAKLVAPDGLLQRAHGMWVVSTRNVRISALHRDVSRLLGQMGLPHILEHLTQDQLFSVDIAFPAERIAIEVDGPHHFTQNTLAPTGEMRARQKLLDARGWAVISVPFFKWTNQPDHQRVALLHQELMEARSKQAVRLQPHCY